MTLKYNIYNSLIFLLGGFYLFGVLLYDYIDKVLMFSYIDELFLLLFGCLYFFSSLAQLSIKKSSIAFLSVILFYLCYSLVIGSNTTNAILSDFFVVIKPIVAFYVCYSISKKFTYRDVYDYYLSFMALSGLTFILIMYLSHGDNWIVEFFGHPSRFATAIVASAFAILFAARNMKLRNIFISYFLVLSLSIISLKAKSYGFFAFSIVLSLFLLTQRNKPNPNFMRNSVVVILVATAVVFISAYNKIEFYFVTGVEDGELFARPAMYITSLGLALDYFPFGSGLASFGSYYSGQYYSNIYSLYGLDVVYGLTSNDPKFVADALLPMILGQFGFFGVFLILYATYRGVMLSYEFYMKSSNKVIFFGGVSIIVFLIIESVADSTLTQNRGVFVMCFLGLFLGEMKRKFQLYSEK